MRVRNEAEERFCGGLWRGVREGAAPPGAAPGVERERRQVTLLFADVVGFTPISERFDPGIVHEMMDGCLARLTRKVERYAGRVNAFTGDGVMALFGAPLLKRATPSAATPGGVLAGESTYREAGEAFSRQPVKANKP